MCIRTHPYAHGRVSRNTCSSASHSFSANYTLCSWLYGVPRNKRPTMLHYRSRASSIPWYCARAAARGRGELALSSRGKGMTLDVVDINGYVHPHGINATVSSQCRLVVQCRVYCHARMLHQFITYAGHHQHRYLWYYGDLRTTCN